MNDVERERPIIDAFYAATSHLGDRYELVDGIAFAMSHTVEGHNVICSNVLSALVGAGKRAGCRTTSSKTGVVTGRATIRYPDIVVDSGPHDAEAMTASQPRIIVEVSSPGTIVFEHATRLCEYQRVESVDTILQIESEIAFVRVHRRRNDGGWMEEAVEEFNVDIPLPFLAMSITLNEIYDTLHVAPRIRLAIRRQ